MRSNLGRIISKEVRWKRKDFTIFYYFNRILKRLLREGEYS